MDDDELQGIVGKEIDDAIDYIDNNISPTTRQARRSTTAASRLAMRKRAAAKLSAWTCATPCRRSCRPDAHLP
jgi:hypothetical protein